MSREIAEEQLAQATEDIQKHLMVHPETTLAEMLNDFYPTPGYEKSIFAWAFWNLVNKGEIDYAQGQVRADG